jgi:hypothetical protein
LSESVYYDTIVTSIFIGGTLATAYTVEELELQDGNVVQIKPLVIGRMRKFMKKFEELTENKLTSEEEAEEKLMELTLICLGPQGDPYKYESEPEDNPRGFEKAYDTFDMPTIYRIIKVCTGIDLEAPKEMMNQMAAAKEESGTTS